MVVILVLVFFVLCAVCAFKESKLTGTYKAFGVYGRVKAYLALDLTFAGLAMVIGMVAAIFVPSMREDAGVGSVLGGAVLGLVCLAIGVLLYWTSYRKCPEMLRSRCILSMIISGLGVTIKICVFFLFFVWKLTGPAEMVSESGEHLYIISGDVYNGAGEKVGVMNDDGVSYTKVSC